MKTPKIKLGRYFFDFLAVFIAVISAFALNNWNDNRKNALAEEKILLEIKNGLTKDLYDIELNRKSHIDGANFCGYFKEIIEGKIVKIDSFSIKYRMLTSDNFSIINTSGYESLKSKGLETVQNDSLRSKIIELYEFDYNEIKKYEEGSLQTQLHINFNMPIHNIFSPHLIYDNTPQLIAIRLPVLLTQKEKSDINAYLADIKLTRDVKVFRYNLLKDKVNKLIKDIENELQ